MGCRKKALKGNLLRFVVDRNGNVLFDHKQREHGRGGYLCPRSGCFELASRKKRLPLRFRQEVSFEPQKMLQDVREQFHGEVP